LGNRPYAQAAVGGVVQPPSLRSRTEGAYGLLLLSCVAGQPAGGH